MKGNTDYEKMSVFEQVMAGLEQSLAHGRGELSLKTTALPLPPPAASPARVIALRKKLKMSQSVFAAALNVSVKLVQSWEQGGRKPDHGELRLIEILTRQPKLVSSLILNGTPRSSSEKPEKQRRAPRKNAAVA